MTLSFVFLGPMLTPLGLPALGAQTEHSGTVLPFLGSAGRSPQFKHICATLESLPPFQKEWEDKHRAGNPRPKENALMLRQPDP